MVVERVSRFISLGSTSSKTFSRIVWIERLISDKVLILVDKVWDSEIKNASVWVPPTSIPRYICPKQSLERDET
jgi:hypothetical protein